MVRRQIENTMRPPAVAAVAADCLRGKQASKSRRARGIEVGRGWRLSAALVAAASGGRRAAGRAAFGEIK